MSQSALPGKEHPLRAARKLRGWSTYELARRAGIAQSTIQRIETGERRPSARTLAKIANALGFGELGQLLEPWVGDS